MHSPLTQKKPSGHGCESVAEQAKPPLCTFGL
jgi:hypothetical protein